MQVDLFSSIQLNNNINRLRKQMETRKFQLQRPIERLAEYAKEYPTETVQQCINRLKELVGKERQYDSIGGASCDSHWELELLGVGNYMRSYVNVIDLSDALDLAFYLTYDCPIDYAKTIQDYSVVSSSLLNFNFDNTNIKLKDIIFNSEQLKAHILVLYQEVLRDGFNLTQEDQMNRLVFKFYSKLLTKVSDAKDYLVSWLQDRYPKEFIYRSKSYSKVILTSNEKIDDNIQIVLHDGSLYEVYLRSYKPYELAKEVIANGIGR